MMTLFSGSLSSYKNRDVKPGFFPVPGPGLSKPGKKPVPGYAQSLYLRYVSSGTYNYTTGDLLLNSFIFY